MRRIRLSHLTLRLPALLLSGVLVTTLLTGCSSRGTRNGPATPEEQAAIRAALEAYLPLLSQGYATGNLEPLRALAAEREVARVHKRVLELAEEGKVVEPELHELTVENVTIWNFANAYATTLEVWDLHVYAAGSRFQLSERLGQPNRVRYQLKRQGDHWRILQRDLDQTLE